jgi:type IV pilus assembly protein PilV
MHRRNRHTPAPQGGFSMIEVLVSLVIFSLGLLALVSLQATALRMATDARDRTTAAFLADQLLARLLIADPTSASAYAHHATGSTACAPTGVASTNATVTGWLTEVTRQLPNATADMQQVVVDAATGRVTVHLCWQNGSDTPRSLSVTNVVQWQS